MAEALISSNKYHQVTHFPVVVKFSKWQNPSYEVVESAKELRRLRGELVIRENAGEWTFLGYYELDRDIN
jgi:hypothetical protein